MARLNQLLARHGLCSRRKADEWILAGRVSVDGLVCRQLGVQVDPASQRIAVDGVCLQQPPEYLYLALNKPRGVVTTKDDPQGRPTVMKFMPPEYAQAGLFPVGRLDLDSDGLLLLTNNGNWSRILLHPRHQVWKEYRVAVDRPLSPEARRRLEDDILLDGRKTLSAKIIEAGGTANHFVILLREGRNRQVRRMCAVVGLSILTLTRTAVGPIHLENLAPGAWRSLTRMEVESVFKLGTDSANASLPT